MAFNATFYTFAKKLNSTKQPTTGGTTFSVELKDNCSVVNPVLRVHGTSANFNPSDLNYCYINTFSRYYWVNDWEYNLGEWSCSLKSDAMASFKTGIGNLSKYVLRSAYSSTIDCVDEFYPPLAAQPQHWETSHDFNFSQDFSSSVGMYVLGVACSDNNGAGAITYYTMTESQIRDLVNYMLTPTSGWNQSFTGLTDVLYRSIYSPFDYIKSCKWFPVSYYGLTTQDIKFGNFTSTARGQLLNLDAETWNSLSYTFSLPSNWLSLEGKYRTNPFAHIYIVFNPWGIVELNPMDFSDTRDIKIYIYPDYISGEGILKIYKVESNTEYFITQRIAKLSVDINLSASSIDAGGMIGGAIGAVGAIAGAFMGNPLTSILATGASSGTSVINSVTPTASNSIGQTTNGARAMDGVATLILTETAFADSNNTEFGSPLFKTKTLNTIPGYIKCADGDNDAIGGIYLEERQEISEYLTNGFFFE